MRTSGNKNKTKVTILGFSRNENIIMECNLKEKYNFSPHGKFMTTPFG